MSPRISVLCSGAFSIPPNLCSGPPTSSVQNGFCNGKLLLFQISLCLSSKKVYFLWKILRWRRGHCLTFTTSRRNIPACDVRFFFIWGTTITYPPNGPQQMTSNMKKPIPKSSQGKFWQNFCKIDLRCKQSHHLSRRKKNKYISVAILVWRLCKPRCGWDPLETARLKLHSLMSIKRGTVFSDGLRKTMRSPSP